MVENLKNKITKRKIIAAVLISSVGTLAFSYVFFLGKTIYSVVLRQQVEKRADSLEKSVVALEREYLGLRSEVTEDLAKEKGFQNISSSRFISRKSLSQNFLLGGRQ